MKNYPPELRDTRIINLIVDDRHRLLRHAILLLGSFFLILYSNNIATITGAYKYFTLFASYTAVMTLCYINMGILVPRFFFRGRYMLYVVLLLLLVQAILLLLHFSLDAYTGSDESFIQSELTPKRSLYDGTIRIIPVILVTTMIKLFQRWMRDNERFAELKNITLTMELKELKNQINPHFLFNMLNGIKALVRSDPEKATIVIMKLSEFLRYQLYENDDEMTMLRSEINFLSNFLELEKLRRDNLSVEISCGASSAVINSVFLPPNLFTTFAENAVKHSVDISGAGSYIRIRITVHAGKLNFHCVNSTNADHRPQGEKSSGLGLANIKRRLELLYGNDYNLDISATENEYTVNLTIPI
ncbi:histidine kinase [uncultured Chitinophaga sp.]|jgi:Putative regulator of cell autolysis|uniref:sensor histidine kinase n=1 Tax=uncultured Chitinophaga sp. TaxID=339340 RepID=UPI0026234EA8|nr:histidine kinase [uncultured Chitinophaga sp.]